MARKENSNAKLVLLLFLLLLLLLPFCNVKWPSMMRLRFFSIQQERGSISFLIRLLYSSSLLRRSIWWCFLSFFFPFLFAFFCFVLFVRHSSASFILCESRRLLALGVFPSDLSMDFFFLFFSPWCARSAAVQISFHSPSSCLFSFAFSQAPTDRVVYLTLLMCPSVIRNSSFIFRSLEFMERRRAMCWRPLSFPSFDVFGTNTVRTNTIGTKATVGIRAHHLPSCPSQKNNNN